MVIYRAAVLLVVLGIVGILCGLISKLDAAWALTPGIVALIIGVILLVLFSGPDHARRW